MERVAVIGLGNISLRHRQNLKFLYPDCVLYAMSSSGRVPDEVVEHADVVVSNISELISQNIQLAIVASPATFHRRHAIPLIESGIPTLIEKPVCADSHDAIAIHDAEKRFGTPVTVGYCLRYLPSSLQMKKLIENEKLGQLYNVTVEIGQYLPDWRPAKDYKASVSANANLGGGALLELSHEIDYVKWMLGPLSVQHAVLRSSKELELEVEDCADILATTQSGTVINIHLDFLQKKAHRQCRFVGSKGVIVWDLLRNDVQLISKEQSSFIYQEADWDKNKMYLAMIEDFIDKIDGKESQSVSLGESIETVAMIEQIKQNYPIK